MHPSHAEQTNPFVGPRAFREGEPIFGRDRETNHLVNLMIAERIVLLYSPSGAGKTSLIRAALIPRLEKLNFKVRPVIRVNQAPIAPAEGKNTPNRYILSTLLSLEEGVPEDQQISPGQLAGMSLPDYLAGQPKPEGQRSIEVWIFDQFEEIITLDPTDQDAKREFFRQLGEALTAPNRWALFSMREDYIAALDPYLLPIPSRFSNRFRLDLLEKEAALQAIIQPARLAGVEFAEGVAEKLVDDLRRVRVQQPDGRMETQFGPYVEPVQLQVVCFRVCEAPRKTYLLITEQDLLAFGEMDQSLVDSSLAEYYAQSVAAVAAQTGVSERVIREWFDRKLITEQGARGTVLMESELSEGLENQAIRLLVDAHLVRTEKRGGATWFELAHDRLIGPVRKDNNAWFTAHLSLLQKQADLWDQQGRVESLLLRGAELGEAERWVSEQNADLLPAEMEFLDASRLLANRELRAKRLGQAITILAVVSVVLAAVAFLAYLQSQKATIEARRQERIARSGQLAALSRATLNWYPQQSLLLAVESLNTTLTAGEHRLPAAEEALRAALSDTHGSPLTRHDREVIDLEFSQDGRWLATLGKDGVVHLWAGKSGFSVQPEVLSGNCGEANSLAISPDGHYLAIGCKDDTARLWDLQAGVPSSSKVLSGHTDDVSVVAFSPDSRYLATGSLDTTVILWDPATGEALNTLKGHANWVQTLAFSPDGRWLASGGGDLSARVWDLEAPDPSASSRELPGHTRQIAALAFSPNGRWLATGGADKTVLLWDFGLNPDASPDTLTGHTGDITSLAFSPDGRWLASGSADKTARLWEIGENGLAAGHHVLAGHGDKITCLAFSKEGRWLATGSEDHSVRLWDLGSGNPAASPRVLWGHDSEILALAFSPNGRWLATGSADDTARLWDLINIDPRVDPVVLSTNGGPIKTLAVSPDGRWLATGGEDSLVVRWELKAPDLAVETIELPGRTEDIQTLAFSPDNRWLAAGGGDAVVKLWRMDAPEDPPIELKGHVKRINILAFSPDSRWLATGSADQTVRLWDIRDLDPANPEASARILPGHEGPVITLAFSPDSRFLATGSDDATVRLWDLEAADPTASKYIFPGHGGRVWTLAFSPDGRWLATGSGDNQVRLWDLNSADPADHPKVLAGHKALIYRLAFSPNGRWLATGSRDQTVRLWDMKAGDPADNPRQLIGYKGSVVALAFSPDSRWLATGSEDKNARLWDLDTSNPADPGVNPVVLTGHQDQISGLAFDPNGKWLVTSSTDATIRLWLVQLDGLIELACRSAGRNFTQQEWQQFYAGLSYHKTCDPWPDGK